MAASQCGLMSSRIEPVAAEHEPITEGNRLRVVPEQQVRQGNVPLAPSRPGRRGPKGAIPNFAPGNANGAIARRYQAEAACMLS